jgi:dTDP-glucose 4,6-dehydratase
MILNAMEGKPLPVYGDGLNVRDWLYVEDHCGALWQAVTRGKPGEKYNVGGNSEQTNLQVVHNLCRQLEYLLPSRKNRALLEKKINRYEDLITYVKDRPGHDRRYAIDASKIKRELGWKPQHGFAEGMKRTVSWYLSRMDWCERVQSGKYNRQRLGLIRHK